MNSESNRARYWHVRGVLLATSALPLAFTPSIAQAQTAPETAQPAPPADNADTEAAPSTDTNAIVVTGIRRALDTAKDRKRQADTFVDSITASDISTLPDLSVAEALGRIPGLTVSRFPTGGASPDFPSPEGRGNLIRGLQYTRSEFNGRDAFSANGGRALDWSSIPPELVGAVDVFKNQTADLIEGGIGGTINLRTLEPFDRKGRVIAIAIDGTYSDLRKKWAPSGSITLGDRWETSAGEFGLMASYARSKLDSRIHGWQQSAPTPRVPVAGAIPSTGFTGGNRINEFTGVPASGIVGATTGFQMRTNDIDRDRTSYYGAAQWRNDDMKATLKYVNVKNDIDSVERTYEWWPDHDPGATMSVDNLVIDPDWSTAGTSLCNGAGGFPANPGDCETLIPIGGGLMESGLVSNVNDSWTGMYGNAIGSLGIGKQERTQTKDISFNFQWDVTDRLSLNFDTHGTKSNAKFMELWGGLNTWAAHQINHDLDNPTVEFFIDPRSSFNPGNTRFAGDSDTNRIPSATSLADLNGANWQFVADRFQVGTGKLFGVRTDLKYDLSGPDDGFGSWFKDVQFGARYAERSQRNAEMGLNWGAIAPAWAGGYGVVGTFQNPDQAAELVDFSNFFRGGVVQGANTVFPFVNADLLTDYSAFRQFLLAEPQIGTNHPWAPRGTDDGSRFGSPNFNPQDISDITETTKNAYVRVDFGKKFDNGSSIDGNIGIRYVRTGLDSTGFRAYRPLTADAVQPTFVDGERVRTDDAESRDDIRDFVPEAAIYAAQAPLETDFKSSDVKWLPSFNVKWGFNQGMLVRFAVSKGLSRPNVQDLRGSQEYVVSTTRENFAPITDQNDPLFGIDRGAQNISVSEIRVTRGNPLLKPTTAWNYDLSYEYYFTGGYVSAAAFYKKIKNVQINGEMPIGTTTIGGQEIPIIYSGLINQSKSTVKGFEVSYQQFYDFLPGLLGNLGLQANYTFIKAKSTPPSNTADSDGDGVPDEGQTGVYRFGVDDMLGQSKHIANVVGIYQDSKLEARLAYNWRSRYLTTYRDYVTGFPVYNSASGTLDASIKYQIVPQLQARASIANILDAKSKARVQIDQAGTMYDRFSFLNDRRIVVGLLAQF